MIRPGSAQFPFYIVIGEKYRKNIQVGSRVKNLGLSPILKPGCKFIFTESYRYKNRYVHTICIIVEITQGHLAGTIC